MTTSNADAARFIGELESSLWVEDRTGQGSSAAIFDAGREGLDFFADFGPLYARYRGGAFDLDRDIVARYDRQREIAFGKLHADAERLRALCAAMSENSLDFRDAAAPVFGSWQGSAADAAKEHLDGMLHSAGSTWSRLATLASTIDTAADAAERIAVDKARAVRALALSHVGGLAAGEVALLVTAATAGDSLTDAQLLDLASLCDLEISPAACRTDRDLLNQVGTDVRGWLDHAFVPVYETRAEAFEAACAAAESDLAGTWDTLRSALAAVGEGSIAAAEASRTSAASQPPAAAASQLPVAAASQAGEGGAAAPVP
ncbi:hypothetical protein, partial [Actinophytocola sp.]|uniref:hypothetical protein n=1 Tax=Actinophytocola sp. TaxID=1872138 RepID=UPI002EDA30F3